MSPELIKQINCPLFSGRNVFWNETGNLVCLATEDSYFILKVDTGAITTALETKAGLGEDGLEEAFDVSRSILNTASDCVLILCIIYSHRFWAKYPSK